MIVLLSSHKNVVYTKHFEPTHSSLGEEREREERERGRERERERILFRDDDDDDDDDSESSGRDGQSEKILFAGSCWSPPPQKKSDDEDGEDDVNDKGRREEESRVSMLLDRATRANEKAGPFEALFVVGSVSESEEEAFLKRSKKGESQQQQRAGAGVMKTYVLDPRVARRLEERAEVSLVDAKEFEGGGEGNNDTNDDTNALVGNIEGLDPKAA